MMRRHQQQARRLRRRKTFERTVRRYESRGGYVRLGDVRHNGRRVLPRFAKEGEPYKGYKGLWPIYNTPGSFFACADGRRIMLSDWRDSNTYETISLT